MLLAIVLGFAAFWMDAFFAEGIAVNFRIYFSLILILIFLLLRKTKPAFVIAAVSGALIDMMPTAAPFGLFIISQTLFCFLVNNVLERFRPSQNLGISAFLGVVLILIYSLAWQIAQFVWIAYIRMGASPAQFSLGFAFKSAFFTAVVFLIVIWIITAISRLTKKWLIVR